MTVSKELALKIREAGFPQESVFYHVRNPYRDDTWKVFYKTEVQGGLEKVSAPTASEIMAELPRRIKRKNQHVHMTYALTITSGCNTWQIDYLDDDLCVYDIEGTEADTLEEALGKMYCQLKKEGVI